MASFQAKYIMFELKKYIGIIFDETEVGYKIYRGIDWSFQIDIGNFRNFGMSTSKSPELSI